MSDKMSKNRMNIKDKTKLHRTKRLYLGDIDNAKCIKYTLFSLNALHAQNVFGGKSSQR